MSAELADYEPFFGRSIAAVTADLELFCALVAKWNRAQNLVSRETVDELWPRHVLDSVQLVAQITPAERVITDLGSGGGFPALPLAIASKGLGKRFTLVEASAKKGSFLRAAARDLALDNVTVITSRLEAVDATARREADIVTSRAMAPLPVLLGFVEAFLRPGGRALLHKGREHGEELSKSRADWDFDVVMIPSDTDPEGVLLSISQLRRR